MNTKNQEEKCKVCLFQEDCEGKNQCYWSQGLTDDVINNKSYSNDLLTYGELLWKDNKNSKSKHAPSPKCLYGAYLTNDGYTTLYEYNRLMINDTLDEIREGNIGYLYNESDVKELMKYQNGLKLEYKDGIYYVALKKYYDK